MRGLLVYMARPEGFEPPTNRIGTCYSIQLSYGRLNFVEPPINRGGFCYFIRPVDASMSYGRMIFDGQASYLLIV